MKKDREKTEEPSLGTSDNGATTAPWQLCKAHTWSYDSGLSAGGGL